MFVHFSNILDFFLLLCSFPFYWFMTTLGSNNKDNDKRYISAHVTGNDKHSATWPGEDKGEGAEGRYLMSRKYNRLVAVIKLVASAHFPSKGRLMESAMLKTLLNKVLRYLKLLVLLISMILPCSQLRVVSKIEVIQLT